MAAPAAPEQGLSSSVLRNMVSQAAAAGELTAQEAYSVLQRLNHPEASWDQIGALLGITGTHCAVLHCRAIPKLRTFMLVNYRDRIATPATIAAAVRAAASDSKQPLTAVEAETFRRFVLDTSNPQLARCNLSALRTACSKVIRHLTWSPASLAPD